MDIVTNIADAITAFGGPTEMGKTFGVGASAVCNWRNRGQFPQRLHYRLAKEADNLGIRLDDSLFEAV